MTFVTCGLDEVSEVVVPFCNAMHSEVIDLSVLDSVVNDLFPVQSTTSIDERRRLVVQAVLDGYGADQWALAVGPLT